MFFTTQRKRLRPNAETILFGDPPFKWVKFQSAYLYQPKHPYYDDDDVCIGVMDVIFQCCDVMKFKVKEESAGMCCSNGTVRIPNIHSFLPYLYSMVKRIKFTTPVVEFKM